MQHSPKSTSGDILRRNLKLAAAWMTVFVFFAGCGGQTKTKSVAVSGVVRLNGAPLKSGVISFRAVDPNQGSFASGNIDKDGHYAAETLFVGPGIVPGKYLVGVLAQQDPTKYTPQEYDSLVGIGKPGIPSIVPATVTDPSTSGIKVTIVAPGPQTFDVNIEDKPAASGN